MRPFWNDRSDVISKHLVHIPYETQKVEKFSPIKDPSFDSTSSVKETKNVTDALRPFLWKDGVFPTNSKTKSTLLSKKIRIYPNREQIKLFETCFRAHRYIYNKSIDDHNEYKSSNWVGITRRVVMNDPELSEKELWLKDVPKNTRVESVRQFTKNLKTCFSNLKKRNIQFFKMRYLSRKRNDDIFFIDGRAVNCRNSIWRKESKNAFECLNIFPRRFKTRQTRELKISKRSERWFKTTKGVFNVKDNLSHFTSITRKKDGSWYIIVVYEPWRDPDPPTHVKFYLDDIVALDPGVRTFQTLYSENTHGKMGDQFCETRLKSLNDRIDDLSSKISKAKGKTRHNMRRRCNKLRTKVTNTVLDLHRKTASFLVKSYKVILIPSFETKKMASKKSRVLSKGTVRNMNQLSHYAFKQRLMQRSERCNREFDPSGKWEISKVLVCSEEYTSKTCGQCGAVKNNLKADKVYRCNKCDFVMDRDINGARNILIKALSD